MSEVAEVSSGSELSTGEGISSVENILGEGPGGGESSTPEVAPKMSGGIARPAWMQEGDKGITERSITASSGSIIPAETAPAPAEGEPPAKVGDAAPAGEPAAAVKPPPGFVPNEALHEARGEAKYFREQLSQREQRIADLEAQVAARPAPAPAKGEFDGFQVLSDEELEDLADEDPVAAAAYAKNVVKYERYAADKADREARQAEQAREAGIKVNVAKSRIAELLPDDATNAKLAGFVQSIGMSPDTFVLTDPETQVLVNGALMPLGNIAANFIETLSNVQARLNSPTEITIDMVPEAVKAMILEGKQTEILNKVRGQTPTRTVSSIPSVNRSPDGRFAGKSYGELSPEERQSYLSGQA